jgi:E3 SUMO-protein ligase RanBP2
MRRDQVLKLCLNCALTSDIDFKRKDDQSWTFAGNDYSEGELQATFFALRFKTKDFCDEFKEKINNALVGETKTSVHPTNNDLIKYLMLPEDFFNYEKSTDCSGCIGCNPDTYNFNNSLNTIVEIPLESPLRIITRKMNRGSQDRRVSFKLAEKKENEKVIELFGKSEEGNEGLSSKNTEGPINIFAKFNAENPPISTNIFSNNNFNKENSSIFSSSLNTTPTATSIELLKPDVPSNGSIFGNKTSLSFGSISNGTNIFGGDTKEKTTTFGSAFTETRSFGSNILANVYKKSETPTNIFSSSSSGAFSFAEAAKNLEKQNELKDAKKTDLIPEFLEKSKAFGTFADFASNSNGIDFTVHPGNTSGSFFGLTVKEDIFSTLGKQNNLSAVNVSQNDSETGNADDYDPHYDPIISLPDEIKVSTGEEDEEKLFGERAKLYRYDVTNKEWKERGKC